MPFLIKNWKNKHEDNPEKINVSGVVENIKNEKINPNIRENLLTINEVRFINSKER